MTARFWRIGGIAAAVLLMVAAWFALVGPQRQEAAALDLDTATQVEEAGRLQARISLLKKMSQELPAQEAKLAGLQQRMPTTVALPTLIRNLTTVAANSRVIVASVTPGRPTPVIDPRAVRSAPAPTASDGAETSTDDAESTPAAPRAAAPVGPQVQAVNLSIVACGTFAQVRNYLGQLEDMRRLVAVSNVNISRGSCADGSPDSDLTATIGASTFVLPAEAVAATSGAKR